MTAKTDFSERDICSKFISPALERAGWDMQTQIREEVTFTNGRVIVRGKLVTRGKSKRADYILYLKPGLPLAVIEAKDNTHAVGAGMQQALAYAEMLGVPFVFASNGDGFPVLTQAEQRRIVSNVDELMRLLDDLEAKQAKKRKIQARLVEAVVAEMAEV